MALQANSLPNVTQPGQLDRRVLLQSRTDTADNLGQPIPTWATFATVWAAWSPTTGREQVGAAQLQSLQTGILRIRYRSDVDSTCRVVLDGVTFEIIAPPTEIGRRAYLDLVLRALTTTVASP